MNKSNEVITIKKYPNRRLYNMQTSEYITLDDVYKMVQEDVLFEVVDSKDSRNLTKMTLAQVILEREASVDLLPVDFLRQVLKFYDHNLQNVLSVYLQNSMNYFMENQESFFKNPYKLFEKYAKQNIEIIQKGFGFFHDEDEK